MQKLNCIEPVQHTYISYLVEFGVGGPRGRSGSSLREGSNSQVAGEVEMVMGQAQDSEQG